MRMKLAKIVFRICSDAKMVRASMDDIDVTASMIAHTIQAMNSIVTTFVSLSIHFQMKCTPLNKNTPQRIYWKHIYSEFPRILTD